MATARDRPPPAPVPPARAERPREPSVPFSVLFGPRPSGITRVGPQPKPRCVETPVKATPTPPPGKVKSEPESEHAPPPPPPRDSRAASSAGAVADAGPPVFEGVEWDALRTDPNIFVRWEILDGSVGGIKGAVLLVESDVESKNAKNEAPYNEAANLYDEVRWHFEARFSDTPYVDPSNPPYVDPHNLMPVYCILRERIHGPGWRERKDIAHMTLIEPPGPMWVAALGGNKWIRTKVGELGCALGQIAIGGRKADVSQYSEVVQEMLQVITELWRQTNP